MFEKELAFFIAHQAELVTKYKNRVLVIKDSKVLGDFANPLEAYQEAAKTNAPGSFMIQPCVPGPAAYTVTITSSHFAST